MSGAVPRITDAQLQASVDDLVMQVDRDTVQGARTVLLTEADELYQAMMDATASWTPAQIPGRMGAPGPPGPSPDRRLGHRVSPQG